MSRYILHNSIFCFCLKAAEFCYFKNILSIKCLFIENHLFFWAAKFKIHTELWKKSDGFSRFWQSCKSKIKVWLSNVWILVTVKEMFSRICFFHWADKDFDPNLALNFGKQFGTIWWDFFQSCLGQPRGNCSQLEAIHSWGNHFEKWQYWKFLFLYRVFDSELLTVWFS